MSESIIPENAVILNELRIVECMDPEDGLIKVFDLSRSSDGEDLTRGKALELAEWARTITISPMIAELVYDYVFIEEGEETEG